MRIVPVADGDVIELDFEGFIDGVAFEGGKAENFPLTIGSGSFIPGFEEQLIGTALGEEKEVNVNFPEEYHAKELAGKPAVFKCKVNSIKTKELPELDDEFASEVSDFETLEEYKADIRAKLTEQKEKAAKTAKEDALVEKAVEGATMDIPGSDDREPGSQHGSGFRTASAAAGPEHGSVHAVHRAAP